jgi:hypothetical protein
MRSRSSLVARVRPTVLLGIAGLRGGHAASDARVGLVVQVLLEVHRKLVSDWQYLFLLVLQILFSRDPLRLLSLIALLQHPPHHIVGNVLSLVPLSTC